MIMTAQPERASDSYFPAKMLDRIERTILIVAYVYLVYRVADAAYASGSWYSIMVVMSELFVLIFILIRRPTDKISINASDWVIAVGATTLPLTIEFSELYPLVTPLLCVLVVITGIFIQIYAKLSLRRSFGLVPANRGIKVEGPYRVIRHPMYAGYFLTHVGLFLIYPSPWNLAIYVSAAFLQIIRILREENLLSTDLIYQNYKSNVQSRLIPGMF
jgi:protein-S-isoprenylcysteine O-methyltransferase Ste14